MGALAGAFVQYLVTFIVLIATAVAGAFCGKKIRENKKAKSEKMNQ